MSKKRSLFLPQGGGRRRRRGRQREKGGESSSPGSLALLPALLKTLSSSDHPYRYVPLIYTCSSPLKQIRMSWGLCFPSDSVFKGGALSRRTLLQIVSFLGTAAAFPARLRLSAAVLGRRGGGPPSKIAQRETPPSWSQPARWRLRGWESTSWMSLHVATGGP